MVWNFRRSVKILPGVRLNFSKGGTSWSFGPRGAKVNISKRGTYLTTGIPGTGLYSRERIGGGRKSNLSSSNAVYSVPSKPQKTSPSAIGCGAFAACIIASIFFSILGHNWILIPIISSVGLIIWGISALIEWGNSEENDIALPSDNHIVKEVQSHAQGLNSLLEQMNKAQSLDRLTSIHLQIISLMNNHLKGKPIRFNGLSFDEAMLQIENEYTRKILEVSQK